MVFFASLRTSLAKDDETGGSLVLDGGDPCDTKRRRALYVVLAR
jgi:hypothetical protein